MGIWQFALEKPDKDMKITWGNIFRVDFEVRLRRGNRSYSDFHADGHLEGYIDMS